LYRTALLLTALALVSACSKGNRTDALGLSAGPNAFPTLPFQRIIQPADYKTLPKPTPGGGNLADVTPISDAIIALGGRPQSAGNDSALLAAVGATGDHANDSDPRGVFTRSTALDPYAEADRLRVLGYAIPSAPPAP